MVYSLLNITRYLWVMKSIFLIFVCFILSIPDVFGRASTDESIKISILTCSPGDQVYSIYGHNAIRIINANQGTDLVYNYGTFDFNTPGFAIKFMRGKLPYMLSVVEFYDFLGEYQYFNRSVTEQELQLDSIQKQKIIEYLNVNMKPENRAYKYDFFDDNCATRLRDIIDKNVDQFEWDESKASGKTFRQIIKEYQKKMPWTDFGIDLIIGSPADRKTTLSEESFIPDYLSTAIFYARYQDDTKTGLQYKKTEILPTLKIGAPNNFLWSPWIVFLILLLVEINIFIRVLRGQNSKWIQLYDKVWLVVVTLSSALLLFMWFATDHIPTKYNWNILWANPLIPFWWWANRKGSHSSFWIGFVIVFCVFISVLNAIPGLQFLPQFFHPFIIVIGAIIFLKGLRVCKNK